ncbi:MAG: RNA-binding S4 domain-containing protein [Bacteroidia bacterium]|nr:RNA-binding S4 domain-containing protein [Bacteroidia bacterium]
MNKQQFTLKEEQPYIALNKLLQILQLSQTGGHAKIMIQNGEVMVNGEIETRVRKKLAKSDVVMVGNHQIVIL